MIAARRGFGSRMRGAVAGAARRASQACNSACGSMFAMSVSDESELSGTPPSRPSQPRARVLGSRSVELSWEPPQAGAASIVGYCVHGRRGGEGAFVPLVRHTGDALCSATVSVEPEKGGGRAQVTPFTARARRPLHAGEITHPLPHEWHLPPTLFEETF